MSMTFTKLFSSITESTIWVEPHETRIVWITMLAMADAHGRVWGSVPGLANRARVTVGECEAALDRFRSPDKWSRTKDHEGRRIEDIDGGWRLLNHAKYRAIRDEEAIKESKRKYINTRRALERVENVERSRSSGNPIDYGRAIAEAKAEAINTPLPPEGEVAHVGKPPEAEPTPKPPKAKGPLQLRAEALMKRRESTPLTAGESRAFSKNRAAIEATTEADWLALERFYAAPQAQTFARKDLAALLNNWNGEIDKARDWKGPNGGAPTVRVAL